VARDYGTGSALGGNAIRRSLGAESMRIVTKAVRDSIQHALVHREAALEYAMQFARDLDARLANRFVSMYVNGPHARLRPRRPRGYSQAA